MTDVTVARTGGTPQPLLGRAQRFSGYFVALGVAGLVASTSAVNGAYFPTAWGWAGLVLAAAALVGLLVRPAVRLQKLDLTALLALWALVGWTALSALSSIDGSQSIVESERTLVYAAGLAAILILVGRDAAGIFAGIAVAIVGVCSYSLATRLFPDRFGFLVDPRVNRLERPLGYWNSLGTFAAMGLLLTFGFASRGNRLVTRAL